VKLEEKCKLQGTDYMYMQVNFESGMKSCFFYYHSVFLAMQKKNGKYRSDIPHFKLGLFSHMDASETG